MYCPNCGKELPEDAKFCGNCGAKIDMEEPQGSENGKGPRKGKLWWKILLVIVICAAAVLVFFFARTEVQGRQFQNHMEAGRNYMDNQEYEEAVTEFQAAMHIDPKVVEPYTQLADAYQGLDDTTMTEATYDAGRDMIVDTYDSEGELPEDSDTLYYNAVEEAIEKNEYDRAEEIREEYADIAGAEAANDLPTIPESKAESEQEQEQEQEQESEPQPESVTLSEGSVLEMLETFGRFTGFCLSEYYYYPDTYAWAYNTITPEEVYALAGFALRDSELVKEDPHAYDQAVLPADRYQQYIDNLFGSEYSLDQFEPYQSPWGTVVEKNANGQYELLLSADYGQLSTDITIEDISDTVDENGLISAVAQYEVYYGIEAKEYLYLQILLQPDEDSEYGCVIVGMVPAGDGELDSEFLKESDTGESKDESGETEMITGMSVKASSQLEDEFGNSYSPYNLFDGDTTTAYAEGDKEGVGIGETITITLDGEYEIDKIVWYPGYQKNEDILAKNGYPTKLTFSFSDGTSVVSEVDRAPSMGESKTVTVDGGVITDSIQVVIDDAVRGNTYSDTCISDMEIYGRKVS